jgi:hypothetical protein
MQIDPLYPGAWQDWLKAYRSRNDRQRIQRILGKHDSIPEVRARIAYLFIENEQYRLADTLLDSLLRLDPRQPEWLALRAQSAFESGDTGRGYALYDRALRHADLPGGQMLWRQAVGVATPAEIRVWEKGVPAADRPGFLESFWARRNPDLFAGVNRRIAEHFRRLRVARREFPDTHPLSAYENRPLTRALDARPSVGEQLFYARCEAQWSSGGTMRASDRARLTPEMARLVGAGYAALAYDRWKHGIHAPGQLDLDPQTVNIALLDMPYGRDIRDIDTTAAAMGYNLRTGLDDRGLTYLRFGPPKRRLIGSPNSGDQFCQLPDLEHWEYDGIGDVRFFRPEAVNVGAVGGWSSTGDEVFRPMNERQYEATEMAMTRNGTSIPAPLQFGVWTAQFADPVNQRVTDVVVISTRGAVAASLDGATSAGSTSVGASGMVMLRAPPGPSVLLAQARDSGLLGRQSEQIAVRDFSRPFAVSDLMLARGWSQAGPERAEMLAHVQRDLLFSAGTTVRTYAEVYGLRSVSGTVRYKAVYELLRTEHPVRDAQQVIWPGATRFEFRRERPAAPGRGEIETLNIVPSQVPAGSYLLRLSIRDLVADQDVGDATIAFSVQ